MKKLFFIILFLFSSIPANATEVKKLHADNGVTAWLVEDHSLPIIAVRIAFRDAGNAYDPEDKQGLAKMAASLIDEGAGDMNAKNFQEELEGDAIHFYGDDDLDNFYVSLKTLTKNRDKAFGLLNLALSKPRFDEDAIERIKSQLETLQNTRREEPGIIAEEKLFAEFFNGHPYAQKNYGDEKSIRHITRADLVKFAANNFTRNRLVITIVGDIDEEASKKILNKYFTELPAGAAAEKIPEFTSYPSIAKEFKIKMPLPQTFAMLGMKGVKRDDPDYYASYILNYILGGGGFESRLMKEVREKRGLAYSVNTGIEPYEKGAILVGEVATRKEKMQESLAVIDQELKNIADNGVGAGELAAAKDNLIMSLPLKLDSNQNLADFLNMLQVYGLDADYLEKRGEYLGAVSKDDVDGLAAKILKTPAIRVIVGN